MCGTIPPLTILFMALCLIKQRDHLHAVVLS